MRDREVGQDQRRAGELARVEDATHDRRWSTQELVAKLGDRLNVERIRVLALDQERDVAEEDDPVDLLDGPPAGRDVVGVFDRKMRKLERPDDQAFQGLTPVPTRCQSGFDLPP